MSANRIRWLPKAQDDLVRIRDFIRVHNPDAANRAAKKIFETTARLLDHNSLGRPVLDIQNHDFRDLFIPFGKSGYWLRYILRQDEIIIVQLWHSRENRDA
jgi:plasmid stabilization system protein ParE